MKIPIGERIRALRTGSGMTQDGLAQAIGVTCQSVSRWEIGSCYPDIELLPALANFFGVTLDELMGMDMLRSEQRRRRVFESALEHERRGELDEAARILREALCADPKDDGFAAQLALVLGRTGRRQDLTEAIVLSEGVLGRCMNDKLRSTVRAQLCFLYRADGQQQKAEAMGRTLPHIWECREILQPGIAQEDDRQRALERSMDIACQVLRDVAAGREIPFSLGYAPQGGDGAQGLLAYFEN